MAGRKHLSWSTSKYHVGMTQVTGENVQINIVEIRGNKSVLSHNRISNWDAAKGYIDEWLRDHK